MIEENPILENVHTRLVGMFDASIDSALISVLGDDLPNISSETLARLKHSKRNDKLSFLAEAASKDEESVLANKDSLTGLKRANVFFQDLRDQIDFTLQAENGRQRAPLHVVRMDLGMLNVVNAQAGHDAGDEYKKLVAQALINPLLSEKISTEDPLVRAIYKDFDYFNAYIVGGDEFALIIRGDSQKVDGYMQSVMDRLASLRSDVIDILPNEFTVDRKDLLDYGIVKVDDQIIDDFYSLGRNLSVNEDRTSKLTRFAKFLSLVADTKADMKKMHKRIHLLRRLYSEHKTSTDRSIFDYLWQFIAKGARGVHEVELEAMNKTEQPDSIVRLYVRNSFKRSERQVGQDFQDPFLASVHAYVSTHIDRYMAEL